MIRTKKQLNIDYSKEEVIYVVEKYNKIINEIINVYENEIVCLNDQDEVIRKLQMRIEKIENSKSWKITAPLRVLILSLKAFKKKIKF